MRTTTSLWLTLACVLIAATVTVGRATASPLRRAAAHRKTHRHVGAQVIGERAAAIARRMVGVPYVGNRRFVAATHTGDHVRISSLRDPAYASVFDGARRLRLAVGPAAR
jgi:hypothetical protein